MIISSTPGQDLISHLQTENIETIDLRTKLNIQLSNETTGDRNQEIHTNRLPISSNMSGQRFSSQLRNGEESTNAALTDFLHSPSKKESEDNIFTVENVGVQIRENPF